MAELVKPLVIGRTKIKVPCWFKKFGCDGYLEVVTYKRIDDKQSVCSRCGVLYLGDQKRSAEAEPTISLKINWLNHHRDIIEQAKERRWTRRVLLRLFGKLKSQQRN